VNNQLLDLRDDGFLLYETDTLEGSSGSPVFNQYWETSDSTIAVCRGSRVASW